MRMVSALMILGLAAPSWAGSDALREQSRRTVDLAGVTSVVAENARGRIEVGPSPDRSLHITALKIVRNTDDQEARSLADRTVVELTREGARYAVRVRYPRSRTVHINLWEDFDRNSGPRVEVRLSLEIPAGVAAELEGVSADLSAEDFNGAVTMRSTSGDMTLAGCRGETNLHTTSGDIELHGTPARLDVSTVSGDVSAVLAAAPRETHLGTTSGDIRLALSAQVGCELQMRTTSGSLDLRVPCRTRDVTRHFVTATVGNGSAPVALRTVSGDITVTRGEL